MSDTERDDRTLPPPRQARSRQTMERLLSAAIALLEEGGLAAVTIPDVAARAGTSTGSVYRRFADKDALLQGAFLRLLETSNAANAAASPARQLAGLTLDAALCAVSRALVAQHAAQPRLLKALDQYLEAQGDTPFSRRAIDLIEANIRRLVEALAPFHPQIPAPDSERAILFALLSGMTLIEAQRLQSPLLWQRMLPLEDDALAAEVAAVMGAYLKRPAGS